jgi:uncharacterized BrkB/YihY/UPF0761 family membrane protein
VLRTAARHRVTGPAAEMSFFALLTLVPLTVPVGAALGLIERFVGPEKIARGQDAAIALVRVVISPQVTDGVVDPFLRAQLSQQHGGAALGGLLLTWWVASHLFAATSRALDTAYQDRHRRQTFHQRLIALAFAFASVVVVVLTLGILVDEPFVDERRALAEQLGLSHWLATAWLLGRWPVVLLVLVGFLLCLYRFAPTVRHTWCPARYWACCCGSWPRSPSASTWPSAAARHRAGGQRRAGGDRRPGRRGRGRDRAVDLLLQRRHPARQRAQRRAGPAAEPRPRLSRGSWDLRWGPPRSV